jgi:two-component system OmpR family sensor kinase
MSLRFRLLLILVAVTGLGLFIADTVTYLELRSSLIGRVDNQLEGISKPAALAFLKNPLRGKNILFSITHDEAFIEIRQNGKLLLQPQIISAKGYNYEPRIPKDLAAPISDVFSPTQYRRMTVPSTVSGGPQWRVAVSSFGGGDTLIVATTLRDVSATLDRLLRIELAISVAVLLAGAAFGRWLVGLGLRPLTDIERTAEAISQGELSRRVAGKSDRTEVGRLAGTFNSMLAEIEAGFDARAETEERLRRFVADASHELRTPLTSIRGYAELFHRLQTKDPQVAARSVSRIEQEADRMSVLIEDLLLLARLDEGRPRRADPVDLGSVVADSVEAARATEPDRPLVLDRPALPVMVAGDALRLRQVIDNLISNVRSHTSVETAARVTVSRVPGEIAGAYPAGEAGAYRAGEAGAYRAGEAGAYRARVEVADRGPGLAADQMERVFERFYRAEVSRARTRGGTGLGLAIAASIVESHGGRVGVESEVGVGARFWFEIPALATRAPRSSAKGPEPVESRQAAEPDTVIPQA